MNDASFVHMEELLRKDTEGEFEIERRLGKGGMAVVYLATEVHLSRQVAIKVLPPELTFGHGVERFKREAKTAAALDHPNIIPIYRIASGGKIFWYAMKFLEGKSLDELLREKDRFSLEETVEILDQVAEALDYAHEHQVIHRDIKPANVMLDARNRVVVTDYGIAKALTEGTLTASGSVVGTPYYMSPEQGMGKPVTGAADQYSVGVMAYRMLSGHVPFEGESAVEILHKHCMVPAPPLSTIMGGLPDYVYFAVHKALEKKPANRFSSVRSFVDALTKPSAELALGEAATVVVSTDEVSRAMTPPPGAGVTDVSGATVPMATTPPTPAPSVAPSIVGVPAKKKSKKGLAFAMVAVLALGGGAAGVYFLNESGMLGGGGTPETEAGTEGTDLAQGPGGTEAGAEGAPVLLDSSQVIDSAEAEDTVPTPVDTPTTQTPPPVVNRPPVTQPPRQEQREVTPPAPTTGGIRLANVPSGATVLLDSRVYRGDPTSMPGLSPSSHRITVRAAGREEFDVNVRVTAGIDSRVTYTARWLAYVWLRIRPAGADEIMVDGRTVARGVREHRDTLVAGEPILLSFVKDGFVRLDTNVTLGRGDNEIRIGLRRN
jgi:serine/threonine-protein kinase